MTETPFRLEVFQTETGLWYAEVRSQRDGDRLVYATETHASRHAALAEAKIRLARIVSGLVPE